MATFEISTPDGARYQVEAPDEATAISAFQQHSGYTPPSTSTISPQIPNRSFAEGFGRGLRDPVDAGAEMLTHGLADATGLAASAGIPGASAAHDFMSQQASSVDTGDRKSAAEFEKQHIGPEASMGRAAGNVLATMPLFATSLPSSVWRAVGSGALQGAAAGVLQPASGNPNEDFWSKKADQALTGAAYGAPTAGALGALSRAVAPEISPAVRYLLDRGVKPTTGQILGGTFGRLEEAAQSVPFIGDVIRGARGRAMDSYNTAALNQALAPIGAKLDPSTAAGRDAIKEASQKVADAYGSLVPKSGIVADSQFVKDLQDLADNAQYMAPDRRDQFMNIVNGKVLRKFSVGGGLTGQSFKEIESDLGNLARDYIHSSDSDQRQLGGAILQLQATLRDQLGRYAPDVADKLKATNAAYANLLRVQGAAAATGAEDGVFTPAQLARSVRALDPTSRKKAFAQGDALMQPLADAGKSVLGSHVPDSGTPYRLAVNGGGLAIGGGLAAVNPGAAMALAGITAGTMGAYSKPGQAVLNSLLASRPKVSPQVAAILRSIQAPRVAASLGAQPSN